MNAIKKSPSQGSAERLVAFDEVIRLHHPLPFQRIVQLYRAFPCRWRFRSFDKPTGPNLALLIVVTPMQGAGRGPWGRHTF